MRYTGANWRNCSDWKSFFSSAVIIKCLSRGRLPDLFYFKGVNYPNKGAKVRKKTECGRICKTNRKAKTNKLNVYKPITIIIRNKLIISLFWCLQSEYEHVENSFGLFFVSLYCNYRLCSEAGAGSHRFTVQGIEFGKFPQQGGFQ